MKENNGKHDLPGAPLLLGQDMLCHHTETHDMQRQFRRLVTRDEFKESHHASVTKIQDDFRRVLSQERVCKQDQISVGVWEADERRVRITKSAGKWATFGYQDRSGKFVAGYEALLLMEMNRLLVTWNDVTVSIEQAYSLMLGYPQSLSLEEYRVYNTLSRAGYYLLRYDAARTYCKAADASTLDAEEQCVWMNLYEMLNQSCGRRTGWSRPDPKLYALVHQSMVGYCDQIRNSAPSTQKRKDDSDCEPVGSSSEKRHKPCETVNVVDNFARTENFKRLFQKLEITRSLIDEDDESTDPTEDGIRFTFDLYSTSDTECFRKTDPPPPEMRIFVRRSSEELPSFRQIARAYRHQPTPAPLMMMNVSQCLAVHCFVYEFTRVPSNIVTVPVQLRRAKVSDRR